MASSKYIFFDIDGTVLHKGSIVPESTLKALKLAQSNGHKIFINTGRCRNIVPSMILDIGFDGYICATGSYAEYHGELLFNKTFSKDQFVRVIDVVKKHNLSVILSSSHECVISSKDLPSFIEMFTEGKIKASEIDNIYDVPFLDSLRPVVVDDEIDKWYEKHVGISDLIYINSPYLVSELDAMVGDDIHVEKASFKHPDDYSGEITLSDNTKISGIKEVLDILGVDIKDSVAVGDGYNDVLMLKGAGLSIAMGNSPADVKDIADYVTDDIMEDGLYNALKHFDII